jgi:hypothetical protein
MTISGRGRGNSGRVRIALLGLTVAVGGCASWPVTRPAVPDLRGNANISMPQPRWLVAGPVDLLHVNVDRMAGATFLRVPDHAGTTPDCRSGAPIDWDGETDLYVHPDESICVSVLRDARVSWHARAMPVGFVVPETQHASAR